VSLAWLTAVCEFPGRRFFSWALLLPLAIPAYVSGFVFISLLDFSGPVQSALREWLGPGIWFPKVRGRLGVIVVMVLALYPYVYLLARNAFLTQGRRALEAAQSLGLSRIQGFFRVALPMARPWIAGGLMLALMETLADFGTVAVFNYDTFTTAIYKAWFALFSLTAASQLASILIVIAFVLLLAEQQSRARMRYAEGRAGARLEGVRLTGARRWGAAAFAAGVLIAGFLVPSAQLAWWAAGVLKADLDSRYLEFAWHTVALSAGAAVLTALIAVLLAYAGRRCTDTPTRVAVRVATLGYALPGAVLAVGIFIPIAWLDNALVAAGERLLGIKPGLLIQGTLFAMLVAYIARFMAVGFSPIDSAMQRITRSLDEAAMSLGLTPVRALLRVHLPILRGGIVSGAILVFVDVMKEMPITLMTRPFGWDTLAVRIFEMTSEGEWERAALPSLTLVLAGLLPILFLTRHAEK
ncbi:MAG TPA: iron ABC transporter permease, partial [Burkholderiales bacterium]|nr:iron ABC transporter permease [Burkholderiales bacterium]